MIEAIPFSYRSVRKLAGDIGGPISDYIRIKRPGGFAFLLLELCDMNNAYSQVAISDFKWMAGRNN